MNEVEKMFSELPSEDKKLADIFEQPKPAEVTEPTPEIPEEGEGEEPKKNRRHRRWEARLEARERELIAREARLQGRSEAESFTKEFATDDVPAEWIALYGNTPESQKAWSVQKKLFDSVKESAKLEALNEIESRQEQALQEQHQYEDLIDSQLESLEDTYDIDLTSDAPKARKARREFLELVQTLSPKDEDGNITAYADFGSTFELYQRTRTEDKSESVSRAKELASRSMQKSSSVDNATANRAVEEKWLRENGIRI